MAWIKAQPMGNEDHVDDDNIDNAPNGMASAQDPKFEGEPAGLEDEDDPECTCELWIRATSKQDKKNLRDCHDEGNGIGYFEIAPKDSRGEEVTLQIEIHTCNKHDIEFQKTKIIYEVIGLNGQGCINDVNGWKKIQHINPPVFNKTVTLKGAIKPNGISRLPGRRIRKGYIFRVSLSYPEELKQKAEIIIAVYPHDLKQKVIKYADPEYFLPSSVAEWVRWDMGPMTSFRKMAEDFESFGDHKPSKLPEWADWLFNIIKAQVMLPRMQREWVSHFIERENSHVVQYEKRRYDRFFPLYGGKGSIEVPLPKLFSLLTDNKYAKYWLNKVLPAPYFAFYGQVDYYFDPKIWRNTIPEQMSKTGVESVSLPSKSNGAVEKGMTSAGSLNLRFGLKNSWWACTYDLAYLITKEKVEVEFAKMPDEKDKPGIKRLRRSSKWIFSVNTILGLGIRVKWGEKIRDEAY